MKNLCFIILLPIGLLLNCKTLNMQQLQTLQKTAKIVQKTLPINKSAEIKIGNQAADNIKGIFGVYQDQELTKYVSLLGYSIAQQATRKDLKYNEYSFMILNTEDINAFACPGGQIFVTLGLLKFLDNEAQLACILGHEITHVDKKHAIKDIQKSNIINVAVEELVKDENIQKLANSATTSILKGYGKGKELEADEYGVVFAAHTGYHPKALIQFIQKLQTQPHKEKNSVFGNFFKMHPDYNKRKNNIEKSIKKNHLNLNYIINEKDYSQIQSKLFKKE